MSTVKENVVLNVINTVTGLLFPLVTFPYVSRVLMPDGIGLVQFYQSIINYIVLISALGIPLYAVREISRYKDDIERRNKVTLEILLLHAILSAIGYLVVFVLIVYVKKIYAEWQLFLLLSLSIFFNVIGVSWFYQANEDFRYITVRSILVRFLSAIALFLFVRSKSDLYTYAFILVLGEVGNYTFNLLRLKKYNILKRISLSDLNILKHLKPAIKIFMLNIAISLYININPVMLGFMSDDACVGYYTAAIKIMRACSGLTTALGGALLPRLSNYFANGRISEYNVLKTKALDIITLICLPISLCLIVVAPVLIPVFSGDKYYPAILTLQLSAPSVLLSALNSIIAIQVLYSQNKEKLVILATTAGGLINIFINFFVIPSFQQNGVAFSGFIAELTVFLICVLCGKKYIEYNFVNKHNMQALIAAVIAAVSCYFIGFIEAGLLVILLLQIISGFIIYMIMLFSLNNNILMEYYNFFMRRIGR